MKTTLFYAPGSDVPSVPPSCNSERFLDALERRDYDAMHYMYRQALETASVLHDSLVTLTAERRKNKPVKLNTLDEFPVYTMTSGGRLWKNGWTKMVNGKPIHQACGWQEFDKFGHEIGKPIGHMEFRKLKKAKKTGDRVRDNWLRLCRPEGPWRRHIDCILNHPLYGNGKVIMTDGHHALFEFHTVEGTVRREEVIFSNLTEIKVSAPKSTKKSVKSVNKSKTGAEISERWLDLL